MQPINASALPTYVTPLKEMTLAKCDQVLRVVELRGATTGRLRIQLRLCTESGPQFSEGTHPEVPLDSID